MSTQPQEIAKRKNKFVFLIVGLCCLFSVVVVFFFREALYVITYNDNIFLTLVWVLLLTGFFFLAVYVQPQFISTLFNLNRTTQLKKKNTAPGISYNVYAESRPSSLAQHHGGWKAARRERRRLIRAERQRYKTAK